MRPIDADALIKLLADRADEYSNIDECVVETINEVLYIVRNSTTISPERLRPYGRWIIHSHKSECTHCHIMACTTMPIEDNLYYCPNCGAKMDGGAENV